jgi:hypothetical protein
MLITVAPVFAQTLDQLIERVEKLEALYAGDTATPSSTQPLTPHIPGVNEPHAYAPDVPWNPSMGTCHNARRCVKTNQCGKECAPSVRESRGWVHPLGLTYYRGEYVSPNRKEQCQAVERQRASAGLRIKRECKP